MTSYEFTVLSSFYFYSFVYLTANKPLRTVLLVLALLQDDIYEFTKVFLSHVLVV